MSTDLWRNLVLFLLAVNSFPLTVRRVLMCGDGARIQGCASCSSKPCILAGVRVREQRRDREQGTQRPHSALGNPAPAQYLANLLEWGFSDVGPRTRKADQKRGAGHLEEVTEEERAKLRARCEVDTAFRETRLGPKEPSRGARALCYLGPAYPRRLQEVP